MNVVRLLLDEVEVVDRLRGVDEAFAAMIAASMEADGQRTPIEVRPIPGGSGRFALISGAHRVRAAQLAGLQHLDAVVLDASDLEAKRLEIEENLCRRELSELDRATFVAEWKQVYEALHASVRHGGQRRRRSSPQNEDLNAGPLPPRFSALAADRLGLSRQTVERLGKRFRGIAPDVRARIAGSWLQDHGAQLDLLAKMRPDVQRKVVDLMLARGATDIRPLRAEVQGIRAPAVDGNQVQLDALAKAWRRAGPWARERFMAERAAEDRYRIRGVE